MNSTFPLGVNHIDTYNTSKPNGKVEKWKNSRNTIKVMEYFNVKYGQQVAPIGLIKVLACISPFTNNSLPNLSIFHVAPTRQFKSRTNIEVQHILSKSKWIDLGDDVTMNEILQRFKKGDTANLGKKALLINDGTTLLSTKSKRTRDRLISGLSVLLSEGQWTYGDRLHPQQKLKGKISLIMNLTIEFYNQNEKRLLGSTFLERFLTVFYRLPESEINAFLDKREQIQKITWKSKLNLKLKIIEIENYNEYKKLLIDYAERYSVLSGKSKIGCFDQILCLMKSHLVFNERLVIIDDDLKLLKMLEPYLINPSAPNRHKIIGFYKQGRSVKDICLLLGKEFDSYKSYVYKVLNTARERGVVT